MLTALLFAQIIQIKTLPITTGDQWQFLPSVGQSIGGISIAFADSLLDPFVNPAKGSRARDNGRLIFFGSPTVYSVSKNAGGGRTLPLGGTFRSGSTFGTFALALQQIDTIQTSQAFFPPTALVIGPSGAPLPAPVTPPRQNQFAFASVGHLFERAGLSVAAGASWSHLNAVDGVDMLYAGSRSIDQHGGTLDLRLGVLKEFSGGRTLEGILLRDNYDVTHDVTWADQVWDPATRTFTSRARLARNVDQTDTWGLHLGYSEPLAGSRDWRVGMIATTNLMSHPKLPDYQIVQVRQIPWDPGYSTAVDVGFGVAKARGPTTFGIDAIFEPIRTHTWGEASDSIATTAGTIPVGGKTTENWFRFSNAILRAGLGEEIRLDTLNVTLKSVRIELGLALRSIAYTLDQTDHAALSSRTQREGWMEWTPTWGIGLRFADVELRYSGRTTTGTGRPGVVQGPIFAVPGVVSAADGGPNFLAPPGTATTLTAVAVTTHQISVSIPIR